MSRARQVESDDVRIHILDDCSDDETKHVIESLKREYPFISSECTESHGDYSDAFKRMYQICGDSEWVWTFGDDDELLPGALEWMLEHLRTVPIDVQFMHVTELKRFSGQPQPNLILDLLLFLV